jgi:iron complex transport system ATP-binding protein
VTTLDRAGVPTTVLATHHLEELPASTTHAALLRDGQLVAAGSVDAVLAAEPLEACFGIAVDVARRNGRWTATAR